MSGPRIPNDPALRACPVVYAALDESSLPIYVGQSVNFYKRMSEHRNGATWWEFADRIKVWPFDTAEEARKAESLVLEHIRPPFNITGTGGLPPIWETECFVIPEHGVHELPNGNVCWGDDA